MSFFKKSCVGGALFAVLLFAFTAYVVLDTFVIPQALSAPSDGETDSSATSTATVASTTSSGTTSSSSEVATDTKATEAQVGADYYIDQQITIRLTTHRVAVTAVEETTLYVADIRLADPSLLKTAFAKDTFGANIRALTSVTAEEHGAILAINGDYYGARVQDGGYVLRNGTLYQERGLKKSSDRTTGAIDDLVIWSDGRFSIINEAKITAAELVAGGARHVLAFGPAMLNEGVITPRESMTGLAKALNPRTAIGIYEPGHYVFVVAEGRQKPSHCGISVYRLAEFMQEMGVQTAYNLDGGGSCALWFNGQLINHPTTDGKRFGERSVSDIVYIGYR